MLRSTKAVCLLVFAFVPNITASKTCPFLGPDFPPPANLANSSTLNKALSDFKTTIDAEFSSSANTTAFSLSVFSTKSPGTLFEYHHAPPTFLSGNGSHKVGSDSIYRIGSVSKLLTVYTFLMEGGGFSRFNDPITKYLPELTAAVRQNASNEIDSVDWAEVTIGGLCSHMAGIGREYTGDLLLSPEAGIGLPSLNSSAFATCADPGTCTRQEFLQLMTTHHPVFPTTSTPIYSNIAWQLVGYALESITARPFEESFNKALVAKHNLTGTSYRSAKNISRGVIPPGNPPSALWGMDGGDLSPAGGFFSTINDMEKIGRAILTSEHLSPAITKRWMKPISHTASIHFSVGAPWEIIRLELPGPQEQVLDLYTKGGDLGSYHTEFVLVPSLAIGFTVIHADTPESPSKINHLIASLLEKTIIPKVETIAREEANANFAGTYTGPNNSSMTISTSSDNLGLGIDKLISNGVDLFDFAAETLLGGIPRANVSMRLYPTGLSSKVAGGKKMSFRMVAENNGRADEDIAILECITWAGADSILIGRVSVDEFAFVVEENGRARMAEARAWRMEMEREGGK